MYYISVDTVRGVVREKVYEINELECLTKLFDCKESKKQGVTYLEIPCAFDIETTNIYKKDAGGNIDTEAMRPFAFMYHWQFCLDDQVCFGRTWQSFNRLLKTLERKMNLSKNNRLVVFVHNLSFEFQFFRRFVNVIDGFYKEPYKPLKVLLDCGIEFRDSYALSNMALQKFCENERDVIHYKLSGDDFNYNKIRTQETKLTDQELAYCYNDVRGLAECIKSRMRDDTLATMPLTSTGYVRRDMRNAMRKNKKNRTNFLNMQLSPDLYTMCRDAFRGGDTHANLRHSSQIVKDVHSYDIASSYPAVMMFEKYPTSAFFPITLKSFEKRDLSDYALLFRVRLINVKYIGDCGIPYIPESKCKYLDKKAKIDNGRVLKADYLEMVLTDIDWQIIKAEYKYEEVYYKDIYASLYGYMPEEFRNTVLKYYTDKTALKGDNDHIYEYNKSKNKLNSCYGMQVMRIDHNRCTYDGNKYKEDEKTLFELLEIYYKSRNSFLSYQQGVWVTAHARKALRDMLVKIGKDVIYCDTDSIKFIGDHDAEFEEYNRKIIERAEKMGAYALDKNGNKKYMGVYEYEGKSENFKTLGAKKYVYQKDNKTVSVIAGVAREVGAKFFGENGLDAFEIGTVIKDSGHLTAFYNDDDIHEIEIDGCRMISGSNVALLDNTYTLGVSDTYLDLLEKALDNTMDMVYI